MNAPKLLNRCTNMYMIIFKCVFDTESVRPSYKTIVLKYCTRWEVGFVWKNNNIKFTRAKQIITVNSHSQDKCELYNVV